MLNIKEIIVVEGIHDKKRLQQVTNATVITTDGFNIYGNKAKISLLKQLATQYGLVILTDSDSAGFRIRSYIKNCIGNTGVVKNAYVPEIIGKERRKQKPSAENTLGVEAMSKEILEKCLHRAGCNMLGNAPVKELITKSDLFSAGLTGSPNSKSLRFNLMKNLNLPTKISTNSLLEILNVLYTKEEFLQKLPSIIQNDGYHTPK